MCDVGCVMCVCVVWGEVVCVMWCVWCVHIESSVGEDRCHLVQSVGVMEQCVCDVVCVVSVMWCVMWCVGCVMWGVWCVQIESSVGEDRCHLVQSVGVMEQVQEVLTVFNVCVTPSDIFSRCQVLPSSLPFHVRFI